MINPNLKLDFSTLFLPLILIFASSDYVNSAIPSPVLPLCTKDNANPALLQDSSPCNDDQNDNYNASSNVATCSCPTNHSLSLVDGARRCVPDERNGFILYSYQDVLYKASDTLGSCWDNFSQEVHQPQVIHFHKKLRNIYWSENALNVWEAPLDNPANRSIVFPIQGEADLAIDWIYDHIYWVDTYENRLMLSDMKGAFRKILFQSPDHNVKLRGIAVDPKRGFLFWSQIDSTGRGLIMRAGLDGSSAEEIVSGSVRTRKLITLDLTAGRVHWLNTETSEVISCDYDGGDWKMIEKINNDEHTNTLHKLYIMKYNYSMDQASSEMSLIHVFEQPDGINYCSNHNCSHFCLVAPFKNESVTQFNVSCQCPDQSSLLNDGVTCSKEYSTPFDPIKSLLLTSKVTACMVITIFVFLIIAVIIVLIRGVKMYRINLNGEDNKDENIEENITISIPATFEPKIHCTSMYSAIDITADAAAAAASVPAGKVDRKSMAVSEHISFPAVKYKNSIDEDAGIVNISFKSAEKFDDLYTSNISIVI